MQASTTKTAADLLWQHWQAGTVFDTLPDELRPNSRVEGYAIQKTLDHRTAKPLFGWKIAATSTAGQHHINVDGPLAGRILIEQVVEDGATVDLATNRMRVAEAEFCFRMARDLPARSAPYSVDEAMAAVGSLHPAIEIPDSRFTDFTKAGAAQLIADNACAHQFMLGNATRIDWRSLDLAAHQVSARITGKLEHKGAGANVLGDPRIALAWIANELSGLGRGLKHGEIITTGTSTVPVPILPGDEVVADFGSIGKVSLRFR